jgi:hypothetical protein
VLAGRHVGFSTQHLKSGTTLAGAVDALHSGPRGLASFLGNGILQAFFDFFVVGIPSLSFWGDFGWLDTPLVVGTVWVRLLIAAATILILVLVALRLFKLGRLVLGCRRRRRLDRAWALVFGNPVVLAYLLWTAAAFGITVLSANSVAVQGRYWIVILPGVFLTAVEFAPRALSRRRVRTAVSRVVLGGLLVYALAGSVTALMTVHDRYYGYGRQYAAAGADGLSLAAGGSGTITANVPSGRDFSVPPPAPGLASVSPGGYIAVLGWALPPPGRSAPRGAVLSIDGTRDFPAVYGDTGPDGRRDGFDGIVYVEGLTPGMHTLSAKLLDADGRSYYAVGDPVPFTLVAAGA